MMKVLLLICLAATPRTDCDANTARIVLNGPSAANEMACARQSQAYVAGTALTMGEGEYLKVVCLRNQTIQAHVD